MENLENPLTAALNRELADASAGLVGNSDLLRGVLAGCGDCIKILDLDGRLLFMSEGGKRVMEVEDFETIKGCPWPDFWQGDGHAQAKEAIAAARESRASRFQNHANTAKGTPRYWDVQVSAILDDKGKASHLLSISRDITEEWQANQDLRKSAERHQFLVAELTHRVKNTLATVSAIAAQTFRGDLYKDGRDIFQSRLHTLGTAYNILTEASWGEGDLRRVVESAIAPYRSHKGHIVVQGPALNIPAARALTMALAVNELATNAVKYGALSTIDGTVDVSWTCEPRDGKRNFRFVWAEANGPSVTAPTRSGFGSRLIRRILAEDFGGTVTLRYDPSGVVCTLEALL